MLKLLAAFLLISSGLSAQVRIVNQSLTDQTQAIAYIGVDNQLLFEGIDLRKKDISVVVDKGMLFLNRDSNTCKLRITTTDTITIRILEGGKTAVKKKFIGKTIPVASVFPGNIRDTSATVEELLANPFLQIVLQDCYFKHNIHIVSFTATYDMGDDIVEVNNLGDSFSPLLMKGIKGFTGRHLLTFDNIKVTGPDGRMLHMPSILLYIR